MERSDRPALIPLDVIFGNAERDMPTLSPDGTTLAYRAPLGGVMNVWLQPLAGGTPRPITFDTERAIHRHVWAADSRHLLYLQDNGGDENWHLHAVDIHSGIDRDLTPFAGVQVKDFSCEPQYDGKIVATMNRESPELFEVYSIDLTTGETTRLTRNPGNIVDWLVDYHGIPRVAIVARPDGGSDILFRDTPDSDFRLFATWTFEEDSVGSAYYFSADGRFYFIDPIDSNAGRLVEYDPATGQRRVIAFDPHYPIKGLYIDRRTLEPRAVMFHRARVEWELIDLSLAEEFAAISALHRGDFTFISGDAEGRRRVIAFTPDDGPVSYYLFDRQTLSGRFLFDNRPALRKYQLAPMTPIEIESRDGLKLHGYLSVPVGVVARDLPMVLLVHGGPWSRDSWGYNPYAQWLTNRGYICLQVNYRGSDGYGKSFMNAGNKEWSRAMHDDLVDAVGWAVSRGYADPDRVAIFGASYGGYAALVGATFTPDLFRCAVDVCGPSNLLTFIESIPPYWAPIVHDLHVRVGNPETERDFLIECSPLFKVDRIKIPMLIVQGANDPRVKQGESEQIVAAMKEKGIEHTYMLFPDEGHGFAKPQNRLKIFGEAERFLARHLCPRPDANRVMERSGGTRLMTAAR